ncbi:hypothetical protein, partial [Paenibacillus sp. DS2015]|uniref:hypothetical protein n=1 Tax=Paenibacillus sp. DS2015 TaxID=3373917 RepID=UPI003D1EB969
MILIHGFSLHPFHITFRVHDVVRALVVALRLWQCREQSVELNRYAVAFQILQTFSAIHQAFLYHLVKKE